MRQFGGTEPLVGEVLGLRTFRVDDSGLLLPLYSSGAWYDGPNTAQCAPPTGHHDRAPHAVPADDCECGFYAYGTPEAARQNRHLRHVQAVVSCWGGLVAGTQGFRAEHARIVAVWMSPAAPAWLRKRVATRYPSARMYADADAMLAEHPLTHLGCYTDPEPRPAATVPLTALAGAARPRARPAAAAGAAHPRPVGAVARDHRRDRRVRGLAAGRRALGRARRRGVRGRRGAAWLVAPAFGLAGWLLRVPLLRGLAVAAGGYLLALRPHHFPVERAPRAPAFCGVRP